MFEFNMISDATLERLREAQRVACENLKAHEAIMRANNGPVQRLDLFVFHGMPDDCPLGFAVIAAHPDNKGDCCFPQPEDTFLLVPVDLMGPPLHGACDVVEEHEYFGRIVAHCGCSFWFTRKEIESVAGNQIDRGRGEISDTTADRCRAKLASMVRGKLESTVEERATDCDPNYEEQSDNVRRWVDGLCERVRGF